VVAEHSARTAVSAGTAATALMYAVRENAEAAVRALIAAGADVNAAGPDGTAPLDAAIAGGRFDIAALLLRHGADANRASGAGTTPLLAAVARSARDNAPSATGASTPRQSRAIDIVRLLLAYGADPNGRTAALDPSRDRLADGDAHRRSETPFMRAARNGDVPAMRMLIEGGAEPELQPTP
jgi:cytohesin